MKDNWQKSTVGDQLTLQRGIDITRAAQRIGTVPVISSGGVSSYHDTAAVKGPGVILGRKGVVGSVWYSESDYWPHDTTLYVKDFKGNHPRFVYYFFRWQAPLLAALDVGSANPTLNRNHVHPTRVTWPPIEDQKHIADILGCLDDKIELNRMMNETLEQIARAIFKSWFIDFDPVHAKRQGKKPFGMDDATAALFPDSFEKSEMGEIPKGWKITDVGGATELIIDHRGKTPLKLGGNWSEFGHPAVSAKNIKANRLVAMENRFVDEELYRRWMKDTLKFGDILMTSEAPLGEMYFVTSNTSYVLSQRVYGLRAKNGSFTTAYLYFWLDSPGIRKDMENRSTGTTVVGIRQSELRKVRVLSAPKGIQDAFSLSVESQLRLVANNELESLTLSKARDLLLPRLLSGELSIEAAEV